jgi:hypothetical protein
MVTCDDSDVAIALAHLSLSPRSLSVVRALSHTQDLRDFYRLNSGNKDAEFVPEDKFDSNYQAFVKGEGKVITIAQHHTLNPEPQTPNAEPWSRARAK